MAESRNSLFQLQFNLLRLQGAAPWQFKAEAARLSQMSEADMKEYVAISWQNHMKKDK